MIVRRLRVTREGIASKDNPLRATTRNARMRDRLKHRDNCTVSINADDNQQAVRALNSIEYFIIWINLVSFQDNLQKVHTRIGVFMMKSQYYYLSWGKTSNKSDLIIDSYTMREDRAPRIDHPKAFQIPTRLSLGGSETHNIKPADGFRM